jgi:hypothetical protein
VGVGGSGVGLAGPGVGVGGIGVALGCGGVEVGGTGVSVGFAVADGRSVGVSTGRGVWLGRGFSVRGSVGTAAPPPQAGTTRIPVNTSAAKNGRFQSFIFSSFPGACVAWVDCLRIL